jgi:hypothetical protein
VEHVRKHRGIALAVKLINKKLKRIKKVEALAGRRLINFKQQPTTNPGTMGDV